MRNGGAAHKNIEAPRSIDGGDARRWHFSHQSLVTPTIRGKESSHMYGVRSFGSVPTCSGWGFSHIERFRPLRMTIREGGRVLIWEIRCIFWNYKKVRKTQEGFLRKMNDRALLGRFLS